MKKYLFAALALTMMMVSCTEETKEVPSVSFETAIPVTSGGVTTFNVTVDKYSGTDPVTIPVTFGGDAVKGEDYSVSSESFVWGGSSPVTSIKVTALKFGTGRKVTASLEIPQGWTAGSYTTSEVTLADKLGYATFRSKKQLMTDKVVVAVELYDAEGNARRLAEGGEVAVKVNTEESTAAEGTHFRFADKKAAVIPAGSNEGEVTIEMIGDAVEEGCDKIVLEIDTEEMFELGQYGKLEISIAGADWNKFEGEWVLNEFVTDAAYIQNEMWFSDEDMAGFPQVAEGDSFIIDLESGQFIPEFESDLANFFIGISDINRSEEYTLTAGMGDKRILQMMELNNTNRNFSAKSQSEDKVSLVGARIIKDETTQEDLLDLYILDYKATDFLTMYIDYGMYNETKPVATSTCVFLNLTFKKAE